MIRAIQLILLVTLLTGFAVLTMGQSSTATISGVVVDEKGDVVANSKVTVTNAETGLSRNSQSDSEGRYRIINLPIGLYSVSIEAPGFTSYVQSGIRLVVNQNAIVNAALQVGGIAESVTITEDAPLINTTTAEVSTRFDEKRLSELPIATNRNVMNVLLSVPGVSQLGSGQSGFANGISFSSNGGRLRSNSFWG